MSRPQKSREENTEREKKQSEIKGTVHSRSSRPWWQQRFWWLNEPGRTMTCVASAADTACCFHLPYFILIVQVSPSFTSCFCKVIPPMLYNISIHYLLNEPSCASFKVVNKWWSQRLQYISSCTPLLLAQRKESEDKLCVFFSFLGRWFVCSCHQKYINVETSHFIQLFTYLWPPANKMFSYVMTSSAQRHKLPKCLFFRFGWWVRDS